MTSDELKQILIDHGTTFIPVHDCSLCGYNCGYHLCFENPEDKQVFYDNGCDCTRRTNINLRSYEDLLEHYNMQSKDEYKESVLSKFKSGNKTWMD